MARHQHVHFGPHRLAAELPIADRHALPRTFDVFPRRERERSGWAHGGAHRPFADAGAVIAHIALHHLIDLGPILGHAERTGQDAIRAADAARFERTLHDPIRRFLDGIGRADLRTDRVFAVHAHLRRGLN